MSYEQLSAEIVFDFIAPQLSRESSTVANIGQAFQKGVIKRVGRGIRAVSALGEAFDSAVGNKGSEIGPSAKWWQPEAGAAIRCAKDGRVASALLHSALSLYGQGIEGKVGAYLSDDSRFSIGGHVFTLGGDVDIFSSRGSVSITAGKAEFTFRYVLDRWLLERSNGVNIDAYSPPTFLEYSPYEGCYVQGWIEPINDRLDDFVVPWPPTEQPAPSFAGSAGKSMNDALALLDDLSGDYTAWIQPVLRGVAASPQKIPGMMQSGSYTYHAGIFNCGFPRTEDYLAEVIIHEISHQYYLLFSSVFPFVKPGENHLYFSAFKGRARPLDRLLLSYHAAANMTLYWHDLVDQRGGTDGRVEPFKFMHKNALDMEAELYRATGLTSAGEELLTRQSALMKDRGLDLLVQ